MEKTMQDLTHTYQYVQSELNRIQTIAGTLATIENQHFKDLTNMGDDKLNQIAVEEQSAARQLGEIKHICLAIHQKLSEIQSESTPNQTH